MNIEHALIPQPVEVTRGAGFFELTVDTAIVSTPHLREVAEWLQSVLRASTGLPLPLASSAHDDSARDESASDDGATEIELRLDQALEPEQYRLAVAASGITLTGGAAAGVFYAAQTLLQLLPPEVHRSAPLARGIRWQVPATTVNDSPRFAWRGLMLDVARHFMPKAGIFRVIDLMAAHRLNTLHWHLTDDQGWRIEILKYPLLTSIGGWRRGSQFGPSPDAPTDQRPHGGWYSQDDLREIVSYAALRQITIVPEIDIPGHSQAAIAAYPDLGIGAGARGGGAVSVSMRWGVSEEVLNAETSTIRFYRDVLDEVMAIFPSTVIGIGGDECPRTKWREDPRTQQLIEERGLRDEGELHGWIVSQLASHLAASGRRPYGWDEMLETDPPEGAVVASWRGMAGARAASRRGFDVVACPDDKAYLDYRQSEDADEPIPFAIPLTLVDAYSFEPVPEGASAAERHHILGGQANLWTENIDSARTVDYYLFPRLCAIAEVLWSARHDDYPDFLRRLDVHTRRLDTMGVEYRPAAGPHPWQQRPDVLSVSPSSFAEHSALIASLVANIEVADAI